LKQRETNGIEWWQHFLFWEMGMSPVFQRFFIVFHGIFEYIWPKLNNRKLDFFDSWDGLRS
jgi:hypothetical protein